MLSCHPSVQLANRRSSEATVDAELRSAGSYAVELESKLSVREQAVAQWTTIVLQPCADLADTL